MISSSGLSSRGGGLSARDARITNSTCLLVRPAGTSRSWIREIGAVWQAARQTRTHKTSRVGRIKTPSLCVPPSILAHQSARRRASRRRWYTARRWPRHRLGRARAGTAAATPVVGVSYFSVTRGRLRAAAGERPAVGKRQRLLKRRLRPADSQSDAHSSRNAHRFSGCVARRKPSSRNTRPRRFCGSEPYCGRRCLLLHQAVRLRPSRWLLAAFVSSSPNARIRPKPRTPCMQNPPPDNPLKLTAEPVSAIDPECRLGFPGMDRLWYSQRRPQPSGYTFDGRRCPAAERLRHRCAAANQDAGRQWGRLASPPLGVNR